MGRVSVATTSPKSRLQTTSAANDTSVINKLFLHEVVVWPGSPQAPGWINLHCGLKNNDPAKNGGKDWVIGWPYKTVDDFLNRASWLETTDNMRNVWFCMSQQSDTAKNARGNIKAKRLAANATYLKAIWVDVDIKAKPVDWEQTNPGRPWDHYETLDEAWAALTVFGKTIGMPRPSTKIDSGGGLHLYWISDTALTVDQWRPYAEGFKAALVEGGVLCDAGLTTDAARILRVPGTHNHKYNPPRLVKLLELNQVYNFETSLAFLKTIKTGNVQTTTASDIVDASFEGAKPAAGFAALAPSNALQAGIEPAGPQLVDPKPIFERCGFLREARSTGGKAYNNPQWNLSVLCTVFMEGGNALAHEISKGHKDYGDGSATQALYERKVADRADRGVGYPSCATIAGTGCASCKTCPLLANGKSPLNIRPGVTATVTNPEHDFADPYEGAVGPPFPFEILSPKLRKYADATAKALGADPSAVAMAALAAISGAMNAEMTVRLGDDWWEKPIIWVLLVGLPSSLKSPIIEKAIRPLRRIDQGRAKAYRQQHELWKKNKKTMPVPAAPPRCLINDTTAEKAAEILSRAPCGSLLVQDEVSGWIESFERYSSGSSRPFYLQAWNGTTFTKDRVGKTKNDLSAEIYVDNLALGILGGIQPDKIVKLGDLTDDGLLQRFLAVLVKSAGLPDTYTRVAAAAGDYEQLIRTINAAPPQQFIFEEDACEVRDNVLRYLHDLEKVDGFPTSLLAAIGKLKGYFGRLCLVLQVTKIHDPTVLHEDNDQFTPERAAQLQKLMGLAPDNSLSAGINCSQSIARETAEQAEKLIQHFLLPHLFGFYDGVLNGGKERQRLRDLADFVLSTDKDRLRPSDFTSGVRSLRGEPDTRIREWVGRLCAMGWLDVEEGKPGAPIKAWHVATGLRKHFLQRREQARAARAEAHRILKAGGSSSSKKSL
jgi:hypothetical protein